HIRREKATSNICTAQVLLAVMAGMYAVYHGPAGLKAIAERVTTRARFLADAATDGGHTVVHGNYFDTLTLETARSADDLVERAYRAGFLFHRVDDDHVQLSVDETTSADELQALAGVLGAEWATTPGGASGRAPLGRTDLSGWIPDALRRTSEYLTHPVFNTHASETSMMRYLKYLADKDYALD